MVRQAPVICVMAPPIHLGAWSMAIIIIDLQALSDAIFFGLGNLGLKIVAMSYEMSLCFRSTQSEPATDVRRTDRASKHA